MGRRRRKNASLDDEWLGVVTYIANSQVESYDNGMVVGSYLFTRAYF